MFPVGQGCKGGCPSQALYKYSGRNGKRSRNPYRNRVFPFCKQQDISIYNVNALNRIPSKPCGTPLGIRDGFGSSTFGIEIDEWTDFPSFAELIGRIIVMGRIKTEIADRNIWIEIPEFF